MARDPKHTAQQIVNLLRRVEVGVANGKTLPQTCMEAEIALRLQSVQTGRTEKFITPARYCPNWALQ